MLSCSAAVCAATHTRSRTTTWRCCCAATRTWWAARHGHSAEAETRDTLWLALADEPDTNFERLAAELRELTRGRRHTPSEQLQREGREVALDVEVVDPAVAGALTG